MPKVSIITAAYNRSNVLRYAIESVRRQTFADYEHLIVGDHCTDDTAEVVAAFDDPRIRFVNLQENSGGQSAPHNHGLTMARGDIILYLNQDDFYFPDHVAESVAFLEETSADLAWSPVAIASPNNRNSEDWREQAVALDGLSADGRYDPDIFVIASSWALRRTAAERIGPWKPAGETSVSPSQELLFRAWKQGCDMRYRRHVSVFCIHSGPRRNSYASRDFAEHERYFRLIFEEADGFAKIMEQIALTTGSFHRKPPAATIPDTLRLLLKLLLGRASAGLGSHPAALATHIKFRSKGGLVAWHRGEVLEPPVVRKGDRIRIGQPAADRFVGFGWSVSEGSHRWTENRRGQLAFRLDPTARPERLSIRGQPLVPQIVEFQIAGQEPVSVDYADGRDIAEVRLTTAADILSLTIAVERTVRPKDITGADDGRSLGFMASEIAFL
jgi:glycosyltransferase involved in cell wall biosynthesis